MFENYKDVVGYKEVKEMLGVGNITVSRLIAEGKIPKIKINEKKYLFRKADIIQFLENEVNNYDQKTKENAIH